MSTHFDAVCAQYAGAIVAHDPPLQRAWEAAQTRLLTQPTHAARAAELAALTTEVQTGAAAIEADTYATQRMNDLTHLGQLHRRAYQVAHALLTELGAALAKSVHAPATYRLVPVHPLSQAPERALDPTNLLWGDPATAPWATPLAEAQRAAGAIESCPVFWERPLPATLTADPLGKDRMRIADRALFMRRWMAAWGQLATTSEGAAAIAAYHSAVARRPGLFGWFRRRKTAALARSLQVLLYREFWRPWLAIAETHVDERARMALTLCAATGQPIVGTETAPELAFEPQNLTFILPAWIGDQILVELDRALPRNAAPAGVAKPIPVDSVPAVYAYLKTARCPCGGAWQSTRRHSARAADGTMVDTFAVACTACGKSDTMAFAVDTRSAQYRSDAARVEELQAAQGAVAKLDPSARSAMADELRRALAGVDAPFMIDGFIEAVLDAETPTPARQPPAVHTPKAPKGPRADARSMPTPKKPRPAPPSERPPEPRPERAYEDSAPRVVLTVTVGYTLLVPSAWLGGAMVPSGRQETVWYLDVPTRWSTAPATVASCIAGIFERENERLLAQAPGDPGRLAPLDVRFAPVTAASPVWMDDRRPRWESAFCFALDLARRRVVPFEATDFTRIQVLRQAQGGLDEIPRVLEAAARAADSAWERPVALDEPDLPGVLDGGNPRPPFCWTAPIDPAERAAERIRWQAHHDRVFAFLVQCEDDYEALVNATWQIPACAAALHIAVELARGADETDGPEARRALVAALLGQARFYRHYGSGGAADTALTEARAAAHTLAASDPIRLELACFVG